MSVGLLMSSRPLMSTPGIPRSQAMRVADELTVLEEGGVAPIVGDEAGERQGKRGSW